MHCAPSRDGRSISTWSLLLPGTDPLEHPTLRPESPRRRAPLSEWMRELAAAQGHAHVRRDLRLRRVAGHVEGDGIARDFHQAEVGAERRRLLELHHLQGAIADADGIGRGHSGNELPERAAVSVAAE